MTFSDITCIYEIGDVVRSLVSNKTFEIIRKCSDHLYECKKNPRPLLDKIGNVTYYLLESDIEMYRRKKK